MCACLCMCASCPCVALWSVFMFWFYCGLYLRIFFCFIIIIPIHQYCHFSLPSLFVPLIRNFKKYLPGFAFLVIFVLPGNINSFFLTQQGSLSNGLKFSQWVDYGCTIAWGIVATYAGPANVKYSWLTLRWITSNLRGCRTWDLWFEVRRCSTTKPETRIKEVLRNTFFCGTSGCSSADLSWLKKMCAKPRYPIHWRLKTHREMKCVLPTYF